MLRIAVTAFVASFVSSIALAQTAPPPPTGPSMAQCEQGWKQGSQWTKDQFEAACLKLRESKKN
jgi:hypothetical protein